MRLPRRRSARARVGTRASTSERAFSRLSDADNRFPEWKPRATGSWKPESELRIVATRFRERSVPLEFSGIADLISALEVLLRLNFQTFAKCLCVPLGRFLLERASEAALWRSLSEGIVSRDNKVTYVASSCSTLADVSTLLQSPTLKKLDTLRTIRVRSVSLSRVISRTFTADRAEVDCGNCGSVVVHRSLPSSPSSPLSLRYQ